jgi:ATP-dependent DNA ligase
MFSTTITNFRKRLADVNLMAVFFDALLVDEHSLVHHAYVNRTRVLSELIRVEQGQVFSLKLPLMSKVNPTEPLPSQS